MVKRYAHISEPRLREAINLLQFDEDDTTPGEKPLPTKESPQAETAPTKPSSTAHTSSKDERIESSDLKKKDPAA
jgi:hypothetical protein